MTTPAGSSPEQQSFYDAVGGAPTFALSLIHISEPTRPY